MSVDCLICERQVMKKVFLALATLAVAAASVQPARAHDGWCVAGQVLTGVAAGVVIGQAIAPRPVYYAPAPPVYAYPAPAPVYYASAPAPAVVYAPPPAVMYRPACPPPIYVAPRVCAPPPVCVAPRVGISIGIGIGFGGHHHGHR